MRIKNMLWQSRRDFKAQYECENCGETIDLMGYDDRNFHDAVIPNMKCEKCGKSRIELGIEEFTQTKYEEGYQI